MYRKHAIRKFNVPKEALIEDLPDVKSWLWDVDVPFIRDVRAPELTLRRPVGLLLKRAFNDPRVAGLRRLFTPVKFVRRQRPWYFNFQHLVSEVAWRSMFIKRSILQLHLYLAMGWCEKGEGIKLFKLLSHGWAIYKMYKNGYVHEMKLTLQQPRLFSTQNLIMIPRLMPVRKSFAVPDYTMTDKSIHAYIITNHIKQGWITRSRGYY